MPKVRGASRRSRVFVGATAVFVSVGALLSSPASGATGAKDPVPDYEPTVESLNSHPTPSWFEDDKFGIFIHWGAYSVPAWGPRGSYAEWYWAYMNNQGSPTNNHHRDTYGADFDYDDFIGQWQAENYDPDAWVKLFKDAGAKYFVLTSKHHEGVALFDSAVSGRDTVDMGPRRDLAGDLFEAARDAGGIRSGFYYSLYEWFNPSYTGRPVTNPYTGATVPYAGAPAVTDYVEQYMAPQMRELIDRYDPDILWCDGQWEKPASYWKTAPVLADYYNQAKNREHPKEVAVANRCKIESGALDSKELDFQTPEYTVKEDIDPNKWEASRGIAHSYGYNQNEPESDYLTSDQLVDSLVDIVSKNGNLLLDVGPRGDGTIPELQQQRLLDIGSWLKTNGEAVYGTTYWHHAEQPGGDDVRYTVKDGTLYATALTWPGEQLTLGADVPAGAGTKVTLLGSDGDELPWHRDAGGRVVVDTPEAGADATSSKHAYVFKIGTPGVTGLMRTYTDLPDELNKGVATDGTLTVTNTGRLPAADTEVGIGAPAGWTVTPATSHTGPLEAGGDKAIPFSVTPPADAANGTYRLPITLRTGRQLTSTEITVTVVPENLARGKDAAQKSTAWEAPAGRAVDGDTDGNFGGGSVTHTAEDGSAEPWWQVDLGASADLGSAEVWNRTDCCAARLSDYWVLTSDSPFTSDSLAEARTAPGVTAVHVTGTAGRPSTVELPAGTRGRYVRVQLAGTAPLSLAEVRVFAPGS